MRQILQKSLPWLITLASLYFAFKGIDVATLISHLGNAQISWIALAVFLTITSYLLRSLRWDYFFSSPKMNYLEATKVLFLGFFMNNLLPARVGELVRAHFGSKISGESRTTVLASIASERLCDGLTISIMFVLFSSSMGDYSISNGLMWVAAAFGIATLAILTIITMRKHVFSLANLLSQKFPGKASTFVLERLKIFIDGLSPLFMPSKLIWSVALSIIIWSVELGVYFSISIGFDAMLPLPLCVLFLTAVNFSSLIPSGPGGIGVIEAVASATLVSIGIDREHALSMVLCQHAIQYLVVGLPGAIVLLNWRKQVKNIGKEV